MLEEGLPLHVVDELPDPYVSWYPLKVDTLTRLDVPPLKDFQLDRLSLGQASTRPQARSLAGLARLLSLSEVRYRVCRVDELVVLELDLAPLLFLLQPRVEHAFLPFAHLLIVCSIDV